MVIFATRTWLSPIVPKDLPTRPLRYNIIGCFWYHRFLLQTLFINEILNCNCLFFSRDRKHFFATCVHDIKKEGIPYKRTIRVKRKNLYNFPVDNVLESAHIFDFWLFLPRGVNHCTLSHEFQMFHQKSHRNLIV